MKPETKQLRDFIKHLNENFKGILLEEDPGLETDPPPPIKYEVVEFVRYRYNPSNLGLVEVDMKLLHSFNVVFGSRVLTSWEKGRIYGHVFSVEDLQTLFAGVPLTRISPVHTEFWRVIPKKEEV